MIRVFHPGSRSRIRMLIFYPSYIPDRGVKKAPDVRSGSATLVRRLRTLASHLLIYSFFLFRISSLIWRAWGRRGNGTGEESRSFARFYLGTWRSISASASSPSTRSLIPCTSAPCSSTPTSRRCWLSRKRNWPWIFWRPGHLWVMMAAAERPLPSAAGPQQQSLFQRTTRARRAVPPPLKGLDSSSLWSFQADSLGCLRLTAFPPALQMTSRRFATSSAP